MALSKENITRITDLLRENPTGLSITDIVKKTGINRNTAGRYLENLLIAGQVEMRHFGMAKIYTAAQRGPGLCHALDLFRSRHAAGHRSPDHFCQ